MLNKKRYRHLRFLDAIFPDMPVGLIVKVNDRRFKKGFYYGKIIKVYRSDHPFKVYLVSDLWRPQKVYWVFRDHIEVPKNGNYEEMKELVNCGS